MSFRFPFGKNKIGSRFQIGKAFLFRVRGKPHLSAFGKFVVLVMLWFGLWWGWNIQPVAAATCRELGSNVPTSPFTPIDAWIVLPNGADHWYAFRDEGDGTDIMVRMSIAPAAYKAGAPANGIRFRLFTAAEMLALQRGDRVDAVGAGSPLPALNGDLYWTGNFVQSGIYYVLVENNLPSTDLHSETNTADGAAIHAVDDAVTYMLSIQGARVSFPLLSFTKPLPPVVGSNANCAAAPLPTQTFPTTPLPTAPLPTAPPLPTMTPMPTPVPSSPQAPLPAIGRLFAIGSGETHWYAFRDEGDDGTIEISAENSPDHCITFALWTPEQLSLWQRNLPFTPVGQGTANETLRADLYWTGSFVKSGIYYVVVEHNAAAAGPCTYQLRITGDDVSLAPPVLPVGN